MVLNKFILLLLFVIGLIEASRILVSCPYGTKSYQNMYVPLVKELASRGHHITVLTNYQSSELDQTDNVDQIVFDQLAIDMSQFPNPFDAMLSKLVLLKSMALGVENMFTRPGIIAETLYNDQRVRDLMANDHFDLVMVSITFNAASYPLAWHFKTPLVMMTPNAIFPGVITSLGEEEQPSHIPFFMSSFTNQMNLFQRTVNTFTTHLFGYFIHQFHHEKIHGIVRKTILPDCPPLLELERNISLVFTNTHPSINYARAMPPVIVEVGGIHCRPAGPLPRDLENFLADSDDFGFILFAVGSMLPMEKMAEDLAQSFIQTFARLPQKVIWQWKGKIRTDLPANVLAIPWLPQQDLLGHKNCKLFITHGGLNSLQEAVYHGVPVLGLPFGTDQKLNMRRAIDDGYATKLAWTEINQESLTSAIIDLLYNKNSNNVSYSTAAKRQHDLIHDQLQTPLERAVYWTEFVIRHGTEQLKMGSRHLNSFQRNLIDVYLIIIISAIVPLLLTFVCWRICCCRRQGNSQVDTNKKMK